MTKLIIGCGYLGQVVARFWRQRGDDVFATTRTPSAFPDSAIQPLVCDVLRPETLTNLIQADAVVYAIGFDRASGASMRSVYVTGLTNVLDHLPRPGKFIYISSSSVYGQSDGEWVDEDSPTQPREEAGRIVLEAELVLRARLPEAMILRFAGIYGPGRLLRRKAIEAGDALMADGNKWLNLIHVEDGARAVSAAEERGQEGRIYNICDGSPVRRRDFYAALAERLGAPPPRFLPPTSELPIPPHETANRRLRNKRLLEDLQMAVRFPDYRAGLMVCGIAEPG